MEMRAVFLDRDGVLNKKMPEGKYVTAPDELKLLPGAVQAVKRLNQRGWLVFVITNQRGIARKVLTKSDLDAVHKKLEDALQTAGAHLDGIYVCPHEEGCCNCRKPKPGLLFQAKKDFPQIDFGKSIVIGDAESDIEAGKAAGCKTLIKIGLTSPSFNCPCVNSLADAVNLLNGE